MGMTRQDYIALAGAIRTNYAIYGRKGHDHALNDLADRIANVLKQDNPRFDRERFDAATRDRDAVNEIPG